MSMSAISSENSPPAAEHVDGVGIVQHSSEFYLADSTYCGLEPRSKHRCPRHQLIPACRVAWGGASTGRRFLGCPLDLPDECEWAVWVDPPPPERVGLAFEELHEVIEHSWIRSHHLEKRSIDLAKKNRALNKELKKMKEIMCIGTMLFASIFICFLAISMAVCAQNAH
ncbi:hypothetical protein VPH35_093537 [Triticum aestivum]